MQDLECTVRELERNLESRTDDIRDLERDVKELKRTCYALTEALKHVLTKIDPTDQEDVLLNLENICNW